MVALLALWLAACGGSSTSGSSHASTGSSRSDAATTQASRTATPAPSETAPAPVERADRDRDNDIGAAKDDTSNSGVLSFGRPATASEQRAVTALIKRYYAAALAEDGARGCAMLYSTLAEAAVEDDAQPPGPPYMYGAKSCAEVLARLFKHYHPQLAAEVPKLQVTHIRMQEHKGFALLRFGKLPERQIAVGREPLGHGRYTWKMNTIYDDELP